MAFGFRPLPLADNGTQLGWLEPLTEPRQTKLAKAAAIALIASGAFSTPFVAPAAPPVDSWHSQLSAPQRDISFEVVSSTVTFGVPDNGLTGWQQPFFEPVRQKLGLGRHLQQSSAQTFFVAEVVTTDKWFHPWSLPVRQKPGLHASRQEFAADIPFIEDRALLNKWFNPLSEPVRVKRRTAFFDPFFFQPFPITTEIVTVDKWFQPFAEVPKKLRLPVASQQVSSGDTDPIVSFSWYEPLADPVRQRPGLRVALQLPYAAPVSPVVSFSWFQDLAGPSRRKPWTLTANQQFTASIPFVEDTTLYPKWGYPWSEPVRQKRGLGAHLQQFYTSTLTVAFEVVTVDKWFEPFSEPVRSKKGLLAALQQFTTYDPSLIPNPRQFLEGWYQALSSPVRKKLGLGTPSQTALAWYPTIVTPSLSSWYQTLAEPVRFRYMRAALQPYFAGPNRILPTADVTVVIDATEINGDVAEFAILAYNPATYARVAIREIKISNDPVSVRETGSESDPTSIRES